MTQIRALGMAVGQALWEGDAQDRERDPGLPPSAAVAEDTRYVTEVLEKPSWVLRGKE